MSTTVWMRIGNITYQGQLLAGGSEVELDDAVAASWIAAGIATGTNPSGTLGPIPARILSADSKSQLDPLSEYQDGFTLMEITEAFGANDWREQAEMAWLLTLKTGEVCKQTIVYANGTEQFRYWHAGYEDWQGWLMYADSSYVNDIETRLTALEGG